MFKLKNYVIIDNKYLRQYRIVINLKLFDSLIINFKVDFYQFKIIYKTLRAIRQHNQRNIYYRNLFIVFTIESSIELFANDSIKNNNKKNEYSKNNKSKKEKDKYKNNI